MHHAHAAKKIKLLLVDDHPVVREGVKAVLHFNHSIRIVGEASDGQEAVQKAKKLSPDVILMDIQMPKMTGLEAARILHKTVPKSKVLIHSMYDSPSYVMESIRSGAKGYILKDASPGELPRAIDSLAHDHTFFSSAVSRNVLDAYTKPSKTAFGRSGGEISEREKEVLALIADGLSNKSIADKLCVSVRTVETHRENIMRKLNLHSTAWLTRYAVTHKIV